MKFLTQVVGTDVDVTSTKTLVKKIILTPAAAAATLSVKDSATVLLTLQAAANGNSAVVDLGMDALRCGTKLTVTVAGAGAIAYFGI